MEKYPITSELEQLFETTIQKALKKFRLLESLSAEQLSLTHSYPPLKTIERNVLELHLDGNKSRVIAEKLNVTTSHISRTLKRIEEKIGKDRRNWIVYSAIKVD